MIYEPNVLEELKGLVRDMHTKNTDIVVSIFGRERSGKSTLAANLAKVLDPTFNAQNLPKRVGLTFSDFARIVPTIEPFQAIWIDEAGMFSKRASYGVKNRGMVTYFQEAGGSKRIYLLCYPDISEIDKKVLQRSRLFFETSTTQRGKYIVRGWTAEQMEIKIAVLRLFAADSIAKRWGNTPRLATKTFRCDYKGIEDEMVAYGKLKELNLERTDNNLNELAEMNLSELGVQVGYKIRELTGKSYKRIQLYRYVRGALNDEIESGNVEEFDYYEGPRDIYIRNAELADRIIENILQSFPKQTIENVEMKQNKQISKNLYSNIVSKKTKAGIRI